MSSSRGQRCTQHVGFELTSTAIFSCCKPFEYTEHRDDMSRQSSSSLLFTAPMLASLFFIQGLRAYMMHLYKLIWDLTTWGAPGASPLLLATLWWLAAPAISLFLVKLAAPGRLSSTSLAFLSIASALLSLGLPYEAEMALSSAAVGLYCFFFTSYFSYRLEQRDHVVYAAASLTAALLLDVLVRAAGNTCDAPMNPRLAAVEVALAAVALRAAIQLASEPTSIPGEEGSWSLAAAASISGLWTLLLIELMVLSSPSTVLRMAYPGFEYRSLALYYSLLAFALAGSVALALQPAFQLRASRHQVAAPSAILMLGAVFSLLYTRSLASAAAALISQLLTSAIIYGFLRLASSYPPKVRAKLLASSSTLGLVVVLVWNFMYAFTFVHPFLPLAKPFEGRLPAVLLSACLILAASSSASSLLAEKTKARVHASRKLAIVALAMALATLAYCMLAYRVSPAPPADSVIRVVTYNIHEGFAVDGQLNLEWIARTIEALNPGIVVLQEVDQGVGMTAYVDEARWLGLRLNMHCIHAPTLEQMWQGDVILTKYPILQSSCLLLPSPVETDVLLKAVLDVGGIRLTVYAVHFTAASSEGRAIQLQIALKEVKSASHPIIWAGDFNMDAYTRDPLDKASLEEIKSILVDSFEACPPSSRYGNLTCPSWSPAERIDYILISPSIKVLKHQTVYTLASDHLPVYAELQLAPKSSLKPGYSPRWLKAMCSSLSKPWKAQLL
ncbi:MAG: hypothetical protein DRN99_03140 [Thermoproteota archaeon]|nr:MAG: hypothetical protein DRN99_03140 [Candidatus Korarchaeota archaeon]